MLSGKEIIYKIDSLPLHCYSYNSKKKFKTIQEIILYKEPILGTRLWDKMGKIKFGELKIYNDTFYHDNLNYCLQETKWDL